MPIKTLLLLCVSIVITVILSPFTSTRAQELPLSATATASVLTCGPGNDFYTTFGHSALRITDTARGIDWVYNYGTFDFNTPHFYWKFTRGRLNYCLSRETFNDFMLTYQYEQRAVWEQRLNLTPQEISNLYIALEWNYLPENRYYLYDILRDNCATRVRDMAEAAPSHREVQTYWSRENNYSYRILLRSCLRDTLEWWHLGIDIILGLHADHLCSTRESMFLPKMMERHYEGAILINRDQHNVEPLADGPVQLLSDTREPLRRSFPPEAVFGGLFILILLLTICENHFHLSPSSYHLIDRTLFIIAGLIGLFLLFMWFGTDHWCTKWNLNLLWASPLLILIAIRLERSPRWALWLQEVCFLAAAVYVLFWHLSIAILPVILTLAIRVGMLIRTSKRLPSPAVQNG